MSDPLREGVIRAAAGACGATVLFLYEASRGRAAKRRRLRRYMNDVTAGAITASCLWSPHLGSFALPWAFIAGLSWVGIARSLSNSSLSDAMDVLRKYQR